MAPQKKMAKKTAAKTNTQTTTKKTGKKVTSVKKATVQPISSLVSSGSLMTTTDTCNHVCHERTYKEISIAMMIVLYLIVLFFIYVWNNYDVMFFPKK